MPKDCQIPWDKIDDLSYISTNANGVSIAPKFICFATKYKEYTLSGKVQWGKK